MILRLVIPQLAIHPTSTIEPMTSSTSEPTTSTSATVDATSFWNVGEHVKCSNFDDTSKIAKLNWQISAADAEFVCQQFRMELANSNPEVLDSAVAQLEDSDGMWIQSWMGNPFAGCLALNSDGNGGRTVGLVGNCTEAVMQPLCKRPQPSLTF